MHGVFFTIFCKVYDGFQLVLICLLWVSEPNVYDGEHSVFGFRPGADVHVYQRSTGKCNVTCITSK